MPHSLSSMKKGKKKIQEESKIEIYIKLRVPHVTGKVLIYFIDSHAELMEGSSTLHLHKNPSQHFPAFCVIY